MARYEEVIHPYYWWWDEERGLILRPVEDFFLPEVDTDEQDVVE